MKLELAAAHSGGARKRSSHWFVVVAAVPSAVVAFVSTLAIKFDSWSSLWVPYAFAPPYADLRQVTATAGCILRDPTWSIISASCDPFDRAYNYPSFWARGFAELGIDEASTELVGIAFIAAFVLALFLIDLVGLKGITQGWVAAALGASILSPATWLALARGNIDLAIFLIVVLASMAQLMRRGWLAALLLTFATILKFFPIGSAFLLIPDRKHRLITLGIFVAVTVGGITYELSEIPIIGERTPQPLDSAFGSGILPAQVWSEFGLPGLLVLPRVIGATALVGILILLCALLRSYKRSSLAIRWFSLVAALADDRQAASLALAGGGALIASYALGINYDYRLIFAIPLTVALGRMSATNAPYARALLCSVLVQMWLTYPTSIPIQVMSDMYWLALAPLISLLLLQVAMHLPGKLEE